MAWCTNCSTNRSPISATSRLTNSASKTTLPSAISLGSTFASSSSKPSKEPSGLTCTARSHATSALAIASAREKTALKPKAPTTCSKDGRSSSMTVKTAGRFNAEDLASITPIEMSRSAKSRNLGVARFIKAVRRRGHEVRLTLGAEATGVVAFHANPTKGARPGSVKSTPACSLICAFEPSPQAFRQDSWLAPICACLPGVSSRQAFAIPEARANAHTSIATNGVLRLARWFEKDFMFVRSHAIHAARVRRSRLDLHQTKARASDGGSRPTRDACATKMNRSGAHWAACACRGA